MINRLKKYFAVKFGKTSLDELTLQACKDMGMKVGTGCHGLAAGTIDYAHCWLIEIGDYVTFAPQVYLLAHDASMKRDLGFTRIAKIRIENYAFIGARALIMPGVTIEKHAIVAAGSVVTRPVPAGAVVAGNPARVISSREDFLSKHRAKLEQAPVYDESWTIGGGISPEMRDRMSRELQCAAGYVK